MCQVTLFKTARGKRISQIYFYTHKRIKMTLEFDFQYKKSIKNADRILR